MELSSDHGRSWIRGIPDSGGSINRLVRDAAYDHAGTLWVLWTTYEFSDLSTQCTLHLAKSHDQGRSLIQVFSTPEQSSGLYFKSKLAVDPSNNLYVLWDRNGATLTRLTGGDSLNRLDTVIPRDSLLVGLDVGVAVGPDYTVYCLWTGVQYLPTRRVEVAYCSRSLDSGRTFQPKVALDSASADLSNPWVVQMDPTAALDHSGALYTAYSRVLYVNQFDVHLSVTIDRGATFRVLGAATDTAANRSSTLCIGADGFLHLVYDGGDGFLRYVSSKDSGLHFSAIVTLFAGSYPIVKAVSGGPVSLIFEDAGHIMFSRLQGSDAVAEYSGTPKGFCLEQNYPNPFNPATTIRYALDHATSVTIKIFDLLGHEVATLVSEQVQAGVHQIQWNAQGLASGAYICSLHAGGLSTSRKLLLVR